MDHVVTVHGILTDEVSEAPATLGLHVVLQPDHVPAANRHQRTV